MPSLERYWEKLTDEQRQDFVENYLAELRENSGKSYEEGSHKWSEIVTDLCFWASPEIQWKFIIDAVSLAQSDKELGHLAAGNIEDLLGRHGESYIDKVEAEAKTNPKFARTLTGCWQFLMTKKVWTRVQKLQAQVKEPLL